MGINTSAVIVAGCTYDEAQEIKDITQEMTEQFGIEPKVYLTPYVS